MSRLPIAQMRGAKELIHDTIDITLNVVENVHQLIAQKPYKILVSIKMISAPVKRIEQTQYAITSCVYQAMRAANKRAISIATGVIDALDRDDGHEKE